MSYIQYPQYGGGGGGFITSVSTTPSLILTVTMGDLSGAVDPTGIDHNSLANLTVGDPHTQYALLAGRSGGQTLIGGTAASDGLILGSTSNGTKGPVAITDGSRFYVGTTSTSSFDQASNVGLIQVTSQTSGVSPILGLAAIQDASLTAGVYYFKARGTLASPTPPVSGNQMMKHSVFGYTGSAYTLGAQIVVTADENWSTSVRGTRMQFLSTKSGTNSTVVRLSLLGSGDTQLGGSAPNPNNLLWETDGTCGNIGTTSGNRPGSVNALTSVSMGAGAYTLSRNAVITTTDATPTTGSLRATTTDSAGYIECRVAARRTGGGSGSAGDGAAIFLTARYKNVGGTATVHDVTNITSNEPANPYTATLVIVGTTVSVQVTGAASNNVSWQVAFNYTEV